MKRISLKAKLYLILSLLYAVTVVCWGGFYMHTEKSLAETTTDYLTQVSNRVIGTLEDTFLVLERVGVTLSASEEVRLFLQADTPMAFHSRAQAVSDVLELVYQPDALVEHILIYNRDGVYRRFRGSIGNTSADRIGFLIEGGQMPQHIAATLEGAAHIGYVTDVYDGEAIVGHIVFLMEDSRLRSLFASYDSAQTLRIGLSADGTVIAANNADCVGKAPDAIEEGALVALNRKVGFTPFQIHVADNGQAFADTRNTFFTAIVCVILMLLLTTVLVCYWLNKLFFRPMLNVMESTREIGHPSGANRLPETGQTEFDRLVTQINHMIAHLEENSRALYEMQYRMQAAEIEQKRTIIISLKKQINAHFTVNTLNVIKRLNEIGENETAGEMCDSLAYLLRYANGAEDFIGGLEEMFVLEKYVDIMRIRYPGRFLAKLDADDEMDDVLLPRMLVQPILENAITHGLAASKQGRLAVSAYVEEETIVFRVMDDGCGIAPEALAELREKIALAPQTPWNESGLEHIALPNIQKRVVAMFGEAYGLTIESAPHHGTEVTLRLPARRSYFL